MDKEKYKYRKPFIQSKVEKQKEKDVDSVQKKDTEITETFTTTHLLNMRAGAGYYAPVITVIPKNTEVIYEGRKINDWYFVKYNDYKGFCLKTYLK